MEPGRLSPELRVEHPSTDIAEAQVESKSQSLEGGIPQYCTRYNSAEVSTCHQEALLNMDFLQALGQIDQSSILPVSKDATGDTSMVALHDPMDVIAGPDPMKSCDS